MKQIGLALAMYTSDNQQYVPGPEGWQYPWDDYLIGYDGRDITNIERDYYNYDINQTRHDLYACPHDDRNRMAADGFTIRSYTANPGVVYPTWHGRRGGIQSGHFVSHEDEAQDPWSLPVTRPVDTSSTIMAADFASRTGATGRISNKLGGSAGGYQKAYELGQFLLEDITYHGVTPAALNYLYVDGHVEHLQFQETWGDTPLDLWIEETDVRGTNYDWQRDN